MRLSVLLLAAALSGGEATDLTAALAAPAGGDRLATLARGWDADALLAACADADPARRRGAARLAAALPVPPERLLPMILTHDDREVRRLAAHGLRGHAVPLAELARLPDADVLATLLAVHPAEAPLDDPAIAKVVAAWIETPAAAGMAARLIAGRGTAARWGEPLVKALAHSDAGVVEAAHGVLQVLTRTQRSLDAYAGDRRLLAQDWRDALAAVPPPPATDPELIALIAELPRPEAIAATLARGAQALPVLERAMADASRSRRRELEPIARLVAHGVPQGLHADLGEAAFADLDHPEPARRVACLRTLAAEVRRRLDPDGVGLLLAALDDADGTVRATAIDQLVRLSDERKKLRRAWSLGEDTLFPTTSTVPRLRRGLRDGTGDEQIAILLLLGTLEAKTLIDDVLPLLLSPRSDVVDAALEALPRLGAGPSHVPVLTRLLTDPSQSAQRRMAVAATLGEIMSSNRGRTGSPALGPLMRLANDPDPRLAAAAASALANGGTGGAVLRGILDRLIANGGHDQALTIAAGKDDAELTTLIAIRVMAGGPDADRAATILAERFASRGSSRREQATTSAETTGLRAWLAEPRPGPGAALLAGVLGIRPLEEVLAVIAATPATETGSALALLARRAATEQAITTLGEALVRTPSPGGQAEDALREAVVTMAALSPARLPQVLAGNLELIRTSGSSTSHSGGTRTRTLTLSDGRTLVLVAGKPTDLDADEDEERWTIQGPAPDGPDEAGLVRLARLLARLEHTDEDQRRARDLVVAWLTDSEPAAELAAAWEHERYVARLLATRWAPFRTAVVDRILARHAERRLSGVYAVRGWLELDPVRLLPVAAQVLRADSYPTESEARTITKPLSRQSPELIAAVLPDLLAIPKVAHVARELLPKAGPLPTASVLSLLASGELGELTPGPMAVEAAPDLAAAVGGWTPEQVLARAAQVRRLRGGSPAAVDAALRTLVGREDALAAAWLRTGLPAEAGMIEAYRAAENSAVPELALVGAAFALREQRLDITAFLTRVGDWPSPVQIEAAAAARRYAEGRWPEVADAAATLVGRLGARALPAWIAILPPLDPVIEALATRAADGATAEVIGGALVGRLARERAAWQEPTRRISARAGGRLDWLTP